MKIIGPPDGSGGGMIRISHPDGRASAELNNRDIIMILAMSRNNCIGKNGGIPWRISADMNHFKETTIGDSKTSGRKNIVVMGRKTFESIPPKFKPLPDRINVILSRGAFEAPYDDCKVVHDFRRILAIARHKKVFIAGGGDIYKLFLPFVNRLIISHVDLFVENGDTFFPEIGNEWCKVLSVFHPANLEKNTPSFTICTYTRLPRPRP